MANPQVEDGHIDLANEIVEALAKIRISGEEMQCLWVVFRKTYGWHKKEDSISLSQFSKMTGISRRNVCRALSRLVSKKTLVVVKKDTGVTTYQFNKDFDTWLPVSKKTLVSKKTIIAQKLVSKKTHTKESIKYIQKKRTGDEEFLSSLKTMFTWIDIDAELVKMDAWFLANPERQKTRRFIVNWLNKIPKPLKVKKDPW